MKRSLLLLAVASLPFTGSLRAADTYQIDAVHSSVLFKIKHLGIADFIGRFNEISGTVVFDAADPTKTSVNAEVKVESVDTHNDKRNQHLKSPDFFNAKEFPTITFKSTKVAKLSENLFEVSGDFSMHGVTKPVSFKLKKNGEAKGMQGEMRAGAAAELTLKRSDYGMTFMMNGLGDDVQILLSLEGIKQ